MADLLLRTRASLEAEGWDAGPLSVLDRLRRAEIEGLPSRATIARLFAAAGVVTPQPRKRPRSSWRRFVNPDPNGSWQIDATGWVLADGTKVVIFQVTDDHSRLGVASLVAQSETGDAAVEVLGTGIARYGRPVRVHSDNGMALNPTRRGATSAMVEYLAGLGVETITGRPYRPTTQGKNERSHQTLHRFLRARPPASTIAELQQQVDEFDRVFNLERPHQALSDHATPFEVWTSRPRAAPTSSRSSRVEETRLLSRVADHTGTIAIAYARYHLGREHSRAQVNVILSPDQVEIFTRTGTHIRTARRGKPGEYIPSGLPRTRRTSQPE
jgi:transposase InsO family protein